MAQYIRKGFRILPILGVVLALVLTSTLGFYNVSKVFAASSYTVTEATATVGSATNLEIEYTVDTALQTWADGDSLTVQLPPNFPQWGSLTFTAEYDTDVNNDATGETAITAGGGMDNIQRLPIPLRSFGT